VDGAKRQSAALNCSAKSVPPAQDERPDDRPADDSKTGKKASRKGVRNYTVLVQEGPEGIVFLHRIAPGNAGRSYGIHFARPADVPQEVLERAEQVLGELEGQPPAGEDAAPKPDSKRNQRALRVVSG
jgi:DNA mismatch repair ATPase MutS